MDEFEEFRIRSFRPQTEEEEDEDRMSHGRNRCHLMSEQSHGCVMDVTEIFPSPVDIYEVRKAWYGDQSTVSENVADDVGQLGAIDGGPGVPRQGHRSCKTEPEDNAQRTPFNTLSRSCRTDSRERLQRRTSSTEKVTGPFRTVAVVDGTTHASSGDTPTSKLAPVASLSTSLSSSSSSSSSSPATEDGRPTSKVTDGPTIQLEQAVYRVRSFSTDNGSVLNLGDSFKVFNRLLLLTSADDNINGVEQPPVHQTPPRESNTTVVHAEESGSTVPAIIAKRSGSSTRSPTGTAYKTTSRNKRHGFCTSVEFRDSDRSELSDADTGDANDERKELLKHDDNRNSSEEDEEEAGEGYELLRRIAFPAIPSPEDAKKRSSSSGAAIALRSLGGEDDGCSGSLLSRAEEGASVVREEGDEVVGHWAGDSLLRVRLIGSHGVGKTTLTQQLMTSEYRPTDLVTSSEKCCSCPMDNVVVVQVDDVQSVIQFIDISGEMVDPCGIGSGGGVAEVDVFLVVYSVTDRPSFKYAGALLRQLSRRFPPSRSSATPQPVAILVANKQDLVRKRVVSENSGKRLALKRRCKFIEISAFLDHRVDELLVGILKQLQLQQLRLCVLEDGEEDEEDDDFKSGTDAGCLRTVGFLRFWRRLSWQYCSHAYQPSSCDDLFV